MKAKIKSTRIEREIAQRHEGAGIPAKEDFRLRRLDEHNWVIEQNVIFVKRKNKVDKWRVVGYYPSLDRACQRLLDRLLLIGEDEPTINELLEEIRAARDHIATCVSRHVSGRGIDAARVGVGEPCTAENKQ